ncbi:MAG: DNA polymerase IV [Kiritimatiellia bacterium]|jgi:DNA polymerase-4
MMKSKASILNPRRILHVDMDAFYAAIEQRDRPELRGKPVVVGSGPHERGVVSTASYEARVFGVRSAMPSREAYRRCPQAVFLPVDMRKYLAESAKIFAIFDRYTPFVEGLSCDEAFLDVTGSQRLFGDAPAIAERIRADIRNELGLTASVGVATNKFLAKVASDMNKPDGLTIVPDDPEAVRAFLAPLPASRIFGVGKVAAGILEQAGIRTIGDIQRIHPATLARLLGATAAEHLSALAFGRDAREVETEREEKSISREHTFMEDEPNAEVVRARLLELAADVARRTREAGRFASTGRLKLRWADFTTITRQEGFATPACDDFTFREMARRLFEREPFRGRRVRLVGFGVTGLADSRITQPSLFVDEADAIREKREKVSRALDSIRDQLDGGVIGFGGGTSNENTRRETRDETEIRDH